MREYEWYYEDRPHTPEFLKFDVLVTTYDTLIGDFDVISQVPFRVAVVDEVRKSFMYIGPSERFPLTLCSLFHGYRHTGYETKRESYLSACARSVLKGPCSTVSRAVF